MCYSTGVTNELVRTLGLSDKTPPGLPGLKPSSNSVLPVAWITRPATDLRQAQSFGSIRPQRITIRSVHTKWIKIYLISILTLLIVFIFIHKGLKLVSGVIGVLCNALVVVYV